MYSSTHFIKRWSASENSHFTPRKVPQYILQTSQLSYFAACWAKLVTVLSLKGLLGVSIWLWIWLVVLFGRAKTCLVTLQGPRSDGDA
jgi:hypothetical protein